MKVADQLEKTQSATIFMQEYIPKYWHFVDRSNDGLLDYSEFKMAWSDIASILAQVGLQIDEKSRTSLEIGWNQFVNLSKRDLNLFDSNHNKLLELDEMEKMSQTGTFSILKSLII